MSRKTKAQLEEANKALRKQLQHEQDMNFIWRTLLKTEKTKRSAHQGAHKTTMQKAAPLILEKGRQQARAAAVNQKKREPWQVWIDTYSKLRRQGKKKMEARRWMRKHIKNETGREYSMSHLNKMLKD